jgi:hypothetical protein
VPPRTFGKNTRRAPGRRYCAGEGSGLLRGWLRNFIDELVERVREVRLPRTRQSLARLADHLNKERLARVGASVATVRIVGNGILDRVGALRWRLRSTRLGRSADGIIVIPVLFLALILGVFAATAATNDSSASPDLRSYTPNSGDATGAEVVTETVVHDGETLRVVRYKTRPGRVETVSGRSVTLPGGSVTIRAGSVTLSGETKTVHEMRTETVTSTVTTQEIITVTEMETVTVVEAPPALPPPP